DPLARHDGVLEHRGRVDLVPADGSLRVRPRQGVRLEVPEDRMRGEHLILIGVVEGIDEAVISRVPPEIGVVRITSALSPQWRERYLPRALGGFLQGEAERRWLEPPGR